MKIENKSIREQVKNKLERLERRGTEKNFRDSISAMKDIADDENIGMLYDKILCVYTDVEVRISDTFYSIVTSPGTPVCCAEIFYDQPIPRGEFLLRIERIVEVGEKFGWKVKQHDATDEIFIVRHLTFINNYIKLILTIVETKWKTNH